LYESVIRVARSNIDGLIPTRVPLNATTCLIPAQLVFRRLETIGLMIDAGGQQVAMTDADASPAVEFRFSRRQQLAVGVPALCFVLTAVVVVNMVKGLPWWNLMWCYALIGVGSALLGRWSKRSGPHLPLRLTSQSLQVSGPEGGTLSVDWPNLTDAVIRGRWMPYLVVKLADPNLTRPPLGRWLGATLADLRPYEIAVPLMYMTPGRDVLRRELARWLPTVAR
jgi:hypothetical protein